MLLPRCAVVLQCAVSSRRHCNCKCISGYSYLSPAYHSRLLAGCSILRCTGDAAPCASQVPSAPGHHASRAQGSRLPESLHLLQLPPRPQPVLKKGESVQPKSGTYPAAVCIVMYSPVVCSSRQMPPTTVAPALYMSPRHTSAQCDVPAHARQHTPCPCTCECALQMHRRMKGDAEWESVTRKVTGGWVGGRDTCPLCKSMRGLCVPSLRLPTGPSGSCQPPGAMPPLPCNRP